MEERLTIIAVLDMRNAVLLRECLGALLVPCSDGVHDHFGVALGRVHQRHRPVDIHSSSTSVSFKVSQMRPRDWPVLEALHSRDSSGAQDPDFQCIVLLGDHRHVDDVIVAA